MNSLKAEEVSLVSYGHLIIDAKLHIDSFRGISFSHVRHFGNLLFSVDRGCSFPLYSCNPSQYGSSSMEFQPSFQK